MPTKQEYIKQIQSMYPEEKQFTEKKKGIYERIKAELGDENQKQWLKTQKKTVKTQMDTLYPVLEEESVKAKEFVQNKRETLIKETQAEIEKLSTDETEKQKLEIYESSLETLETADETKSAVFSVGEVSWNLELSNYTPFKEKFEEMKALKSRENDLLIFEEVGKEKKKHEKLIAEVEQEVRDTLKEKETVVESLNALQKLLAKIMPKQWYRPAREIEELENYKLAFEELGIPAEAPVVTDDEPTDEEISETEGEALTDEQLEELKWATGLDS